ncbi:hypothetical protein GCM10029976_046900 [Kribbella albertanoniae]|uniref:DUF4333 domain-containing protein n=1 Tax=Kribbella albertanoniae TaxID=1266829 RepID=A0A4R4Q456_9ACTN|nr:DUF4333 domain-containing protein [Kribbella albertanoniae]TDC29824.1 DUF4333 domain-containing protein [Kribbella albertanoniae]
MLLAVRTTLAGAACVLVALTGCSASFGEASISKENLETGIIDALEKSVGKRPDSVTCPGKVKAKVGESIRCELAAGTSKYGLTATITSYDKESKNVKYDIKVDQKRAN